jgi:signal transduction histidine kinase
MSSSSLRGRGLRAQLTYTVVLVAVPPALLFGILAIARHQADVASEVTRGHEALVSVLGQAVHESLQDARRAVGVTARALADDLPAVEGAGPPPAPNEVEAAALEARPAARALRALKTEFPLLARAGLLGAGGRLLQGDAPPDGLEVQHANTYGGYLSEVYFARQGQGRESPHVALVVQARDRAGRLRGFVWADLDLSFVQKLCAGLALPRQAELLVVDGQGRLVANSSGRQLIGQALRPGDPAVDRALSGYGIGRTIFNAGGEERFAVYRNLADLGGERGLRWAVIVEQPTRAAFAVARKTTRDATFALAGLLAMAVVAGAVLSRRLARPLDWLSARARELEQSAGGRPDEGTATPAPEMAEPVTQRQDEVGLLARSFVSMAARVRATQGRLDEANRFLEELVATLPVGVLTLDGMGVIRRMNRAQELLSGRSAAELTGRHVNEGFPELPAAPDTHPLGEVLAELLQRPVPPSSGRTASSTDARGFDQVLRGQRTRFLPEPLVRSRVSMAPLLGVVGGGVVIVMEDLSRMAALEDELRRAERLSTVGVLAAGVAHEINNPLTTILGYALLLCEDKPADHRDRPGLELVVEEAKRVQGIVRTLLDYSRREPGAREPTDLNASVERTLTLTQPQLKKCGVQVERELDRQLPFVRADGPRLEQVFVNLIQNAAHALATRPGPRQLVVRSKVTEGQVALEFSDNGPGISPEAVGRIFEPFFTTKDPGLGTGLGLTVARDIIADHAGSLQVESTVGVGTTFRVLLPAPQLQ